jgi:hypothetical protein
MSKTAKSTGLGTQAAKPAATAAHARLTKSKLIKPGARRPSVAPKVAPSNGATGKLPDSLPKPRYARRAEVLAAARESLAELAKTYELLAK